LLLSEELEFYVVDDPQIRPRVRASVMVLAALQRAGRRVPGHRKC
jgi:hypothetical protein